MKKTAYKKGFTLIELLIVIAILGVLAVVVLVAINPVQQLARTRDAGRQSSVGQYGRALVAYSTARNSLFPAAAATWAQALVDSGEVSQLPNGPTYSAPATGTHPAPAACTTNVVGTFCYNAYGALSRAIVYARAESGVSNDRCGATQAAWFVFSSTNGSAGILCTAAAATEPADPGVTGYSGANWIQ